MAPRWCSEERRLSYMLTPSVRAHQGGTYQIAHGVCLPKLGFAELTQSLEIRSESRLNIFHQTAKWTPKNSSNGCCECACNPPNPNSLLLPWFSNTWPCETLNIKQKQKMKLKVTQTLHQGITSVDILVNSFPDIFLCIYTEINVYIYF